MNHNDEPLIYLETDRLLLREFTADDANLLFELDSDPEVIRYADVPFILEGKLPDYDRYPNQVLPRFLTAYQQSNHQFGFWAAIVKSTRQFIGWFEFNPDPKVGGDVELGYRLKREAWGHGYATEGAKALIAKGFLELQIPRVAAVALEENRASTRVMKKVGLKFEREEFYEPLGRSLVLYGLNREDFHSA
ncbi:GNAT family N-acetyltransferase [Leptolyngbya sp. FACHB-36]|uniref:GNAT family N-acetyltransferase n=1 Tax=Leptolyngbya sp. FACHB-36 TaxID=2692808 RepID=UPI001680EF5D|nr:GNAT family N-acetyltransferase [Leptolyngbya sp. FACHB-36]MBD2020240.1 GNAT family N-acetyltransferase [Leptolyngbya sp. FACHB-36]